jgi:osmoprotectant transport system substrate-binding protein
MRPTVRTLTALVGVAVLGLAACGSDNSGSSSGATTAASSGGGATTTAAPTATTAAGGGGAITESFTVGSGNFPESVLLGEIYGGALEAKGAKITKKPNIGNRETYYKAIAGGELDLLPEYTNSLLSFLVHQKDPNGSPTAKNVSEQVTELKSILPENLTVLTPSTAEDKDVIVCNKETTGKYSFKTLSDLAAKAGEITLGGPPEFATRTPFGIPGFKQFYNASFKQFVPLEIGPPIVDALKANAVNCANLFSTNSAINTNGFTALTDDKTIVPNEAVLPLINKAKANPNVTAALDAVNAKLDTDGLVKMMVEIEVDKKAEVDVAKEWLKANGFTK